MRAKIGALNEQKNISINNGAYKAGFSSNEDIYANAFTNCFDTLDALETRVTGAGRLTRRKLQAVLPGSIPGTSMSIRALFLRRHALQQQLRSGGKAVHPITSAGKHYRHPAPPWSPRRTRHGGSHHATDIGGRSGNEIRSCLRQLRCGLPPPTYTD